MKNQQPTNWPMEWIPWKFTTSSDDNVQAESIIAFTLMKRTFHNEKYKTWIWESLYSIDIIIKDMLTEINGINQSSSKSVTIELSDEEYNLINKLVIDGLFLSSSDFVREAMLEKLRNMDVIHLRDIPYEQQEKEIIEYAKTHDVFDALDIADALKLDVFEVNEIMAKLIKENVLEEL